MIISNSRKFVFVHIHKCAGTSVEVALEKTLTYNDILIGSTDRGENQQNLMKSLIGLEKHSTAREVMDFIGSTRWDGYYSFAFVRHPIARLASLYRYCIRLAQTSRLSDMEKEELEKGNFPNRAPFTYAAVKAAVASADFNEFIWDERTWKDPGAQRQVDSLCVSGKLIVSKVYRVEDMATAWPEIMRKFPGAVDIPNLNITEGKGSQINYPDISDDSKNHLLEIYKDDFSMFNYE